MKTKIIDKLYSLHRFGIKPGLERITYILSSSGNPHKAFKSIHIAGTNGKGSTSSLLASILMEYGLKVGLYTSPHLVRFNERIKINGIEVDDDTLVGLAEKYLPFSEKVSGTFFEITTAMAFDYFAQNNVDIAIIETGMGGRFDATNIITPIVSGITSISLEHKEYLGDTIEKIAFEKAGIIKDNIPVVISKNSDCVYDVFKEVANEKNSKLVIADSLETVIQHKFLPNLKTEVCVNFKNNLAYTELPLAGKHQIDNLELVLAILLQTDYEISLENIKDGIENLKQNTGLSTRIELIKSDPYVIIDSAHNEAAIKSLVEAIELHIPNTKFDITFAAMSDKDIRSILHHLINICNSLIVTKPKIDRAADIDSIAKIAVELGYKDIKVCESTESAFENMQLNLNNLIVGSFYLTGELLPQLNKI